MIYFLQCFPMAPICANRKEAHGQHHIVSQSSCSWAGTSFARWVENLYLQLPALTSSCPPAASENIPHASVAPLRTTRSSDPSGISSILRYKSVVDGPPTAVAVAPPEATGIFSLNQWATSEWDTGTGLLLEQMISVELFCSSFLPRNSTNVTLESFSHLRSTQISVQQAQSCISFLWMNSYPKLLVRCNLKELVIDLPKSSL